jgi:hypothetical protein
MTSGHDPCCSARNVCSFLGLKSLLCLYNLTRSSPAFFSRGGTPCCPGERSESWTTQKSPVFIGWIF